MVCALQIVIHLWTEKAARDGVILSATQVYHPARDAIYRGDPGTRIWTIMWAHTADFHPLL
jgi:hypothetical protein